MNVTQKVGREVRIFGRMLWYICSYDGAVILTDETERSVGLHQAKSLSSVHLSSTRSILLVLLFLLYASTIALYKALAESSGCFLLKQGRAH